MSALLAKAQAKGMSWREGALGENYSYDSVLDGIFTHTSRQTKNMVHLQERAVAGRQGQSENPRQWLGTDSGQCGCAGGYFPGSSVPRQQEGKRPGILEPRAGYS